MPADRDSGGHDRAADTVKITETHSAGADSAYDIDPDTENYAAGNDPENAYRNQGRSDSPNSWSNYADGADENAGPPEASRDGESADLWGDVDPDAANYADLDVHQPDRAEPVEADAERISSLEQRIGTLESEKADDRQKIADLEAKVDALTARPDRIEKPQASRERQPDGADAREHTEDRPDTSADQPETLNEAPGEHRATIAEHEDNRGGSDAKEAESTRSRRVTIAENLGIAGQVISAADTVAQFAMHATPEGAVGVGVAILGLASFGLAKAGEKGKGKA